MKIKAYSKVNLCLKIFKKRPDESKHKVDSVISLYKELYDDVIIKPSDTLKVIYKRGKATITITECLVYKSIEYLKEKYGWDINLDIVIKKRIPFGAGLGGGSSNAAVVINYIVAQHPNTILNLKEIAMQLGSDIPFFLSGLELARVKNYGEYVSPIVNWHPKYHVDLNGIYSQTKLVFGLLDEDENYQSRVDVDKFIKSHLYKQHLLNVVYNDLTKYIINNNKELQTLYKKYDSHSFFTGAGSSIVTIEE